MGENGIIIRNHDLWQDFFRISVKILSNDVIHSCPCFMMIEISLICINYANMQISIPGCNEYALHRNVYKIFLFFVTVKRLLTSKISSTCPTGVNYISKYAGNLREKSHEVSTWNSNRSRCTAKKNDRGGPKRPPPHGIRVKELGE